MIEKAKIEAAKKIAEENYSTWGQWVIECMDDKDIADGFIAVTGEELTLEEWVSLREDVTGYYREIENTAW